MNPTQSAEPSFRYIEDAGEVLDRAHTLLLNPTPQNLDIACSALAMAVNQITGLQAVLAARPSPDLAARVIDLRKTIGLVSSLLEHAAAYHVNLIHCMMDAVVVPVPQAPCGAPGQRLFLEA